MCLDGQINDSAVAAIGFYGDRLRIGYGSLGGWDPFGPDRLITRSEGNVLYELDGSSALELYKTYLGARTPPSLPGERPALSLEPPLARSRRDPAWCAPSSALDEQAQSMVFAGDMPVGARDAQLYEGQFQPPGRRRPSAPPRTPWPQLDGCHAPESWPS